MDPIKNGDIPASHAGLPEGNLYFRATSAAEQSLTWTLRYWPEYPEASVKHVTS